MPSSRSSAAGARSAGWLGAALLLAAALFDAPALYVPGLAFGLLAALAVAWVASGARGLRVERHLGGARVVEDEPLALEVHVTSPRVALPSCLVEDPLLDGAVAVRGGRRRAVVAVEARFPRRGRRLVDPPAVVVRDPIGLAQRVVRGTGRDEVVVLPRVEPVVVPDAGAGRRGTVTGRPRPGVAPAAEVDIDGLRPHREGAPASRIHWPALARTGELLERRLRPEGDARPLVVLDARGHDDAAVDAAVRAAASLCVHLARHGGCSLLLGGLRRPEALEPGLAGWPHLHARLALVEPGAVPPLTGVAQRRGAIFYVAARALSRPPRALLHAPSAGRYVVTPVPLRGRPAAFSVAGCIGYDLAGARRRTAA